MLTPIPLKRMINMIKQAQKETRCLMDMDHETESQTEAGTLEPQASKETKIYHSGFFKTYFGNLQV